MLKIEANSGQCSFAIRINFHSNKARLSMIDDDLKYFIATDKNPLPNDLKTKINKFIHSFKNTTLFDSC